MSAVVRKDPRVMVLKVANHEEGEVMVTLHPGSGFWQEGISGSSMIHTTS